MNFVLKLFGGSCLLLAGAIVLAGIILCQSSRLARCGLIVLLLLPLAIGCLVEWALRRATA